MRYIIDLLIDTLARGESVVLGAVVRSSGSAPRTTGARMLVRADGSLAGTIGGGAIEGECQEKARDLFDSKVSHALLNFSLGSKTLAEGGMICGGAVTILLHRVDPDSLPTLLHTRSLYQSGKRPKLLTFMPVAESPPRLALFDSSDDHLLDDEVREQISEKGLRVPFTAKSGDQEIFVEPIVSPGVVHIVGAGHVALETAQLSVFAGFEVVVMDDRPEFANKQRYPDVQKVIVLESFADCLSNLTADDYVVIVTRGHLYDRVVLAQALRTNAGYIGMIGSRKKRDIIYDSLKEEGFADSDLARVRSPIGIDIRADTPQEIAVSIVAELIRARSER